MSEAKLVGEINRFGALVADLRTENGILQRSHDQLQAHAEKLDVEAQKWAGEAERLTSSLSDVTTERNAARAISDPHVCDFISNESAELGGNGWREIDEDPEGMEAELSYAASRGLIERMPDYVGRFRFTDAAKEFL